MEDLTSPKSTPLTILENDFNELLKQNNATVNIAPEELKSLEMHAIINFDHSRYSPALASSVLYKILVKNNLSYADAQKVLIGDMNWAEAGIRLGIANDPNNKDPMTASVALRTGIEKNYLQDADANLAFDEFTFFASNLPEIGPIIGNTLSLFGLAADIEASTNDQLLKYGGDLWPYSSGKPSYELSLQKVYETISSNEKKAFSSLSNELYNDTLTYTVYDSIIVNKENFISQGYEITNSILRSLDAKNQADNLNKKLSKDELAIINESYAIKRSKINDDSVALLSQLEEYSGNSHIDEIERRRINNILLDMYSNAFGSENSDAERLGENLLGVQTWLDQRHEEYYNAYNNPNNNKIDVEKYYTQLISRYATAQLHDIFPQLEGKASTALENINSSYRGYSTNPSIMREAEKYIKSVFSTVDIKDYDSYLKGLYYPYLQSFDTSTPISTHQYEYNIPYIINIPLPPNSNSTDMTIASLKEYYKNKDGVVPSYLVNAEYYKKLNDIMNTGKNRNYSIKDWEWAQQEDLSNTISTIQSYSDVAAFVDAEISKMPPDKQKKVDRNKLIIYILEHPIDSIPKTVIITPTPTKVPQEFHNLHANGGRATEVSIFGEAGPEWAIPERHDSRTAELLNSAREASGFSWTELIASTGGLNGGGNVISNNITYAPVVHANDASGVENVLTKDKQMLDDWWKQKQWEMARTQWA